MEGERDRKRERNQPISGLWITKLNIVKIAISFQLIYKVNAFFQKSQQTSLQRLKSSL